MRARRTAPLMLFVALLAALAVFAQVSIQPRPVPHKTADPPAPKATLRVDSNLVLVPVSVTDPNNRPVTGLEPEHFKIFDDHVEQTITHFAMDDEPVSVGLVFDISGSMGPKIRLSRLAASAFFQTANPDDEFSLVEFNDQVRLVTPLTQDFDEIQNQLTFAQSKGRTALLDAIVMGLNETKRSKKNRKALLIISDGGDNSSRYSEGEVRSMVRESDVLVYAIGIFEPWGSRSRTPEEAAGPGLLNDLAEQSGGRHYPADANELPDIAAKIGMELRNRYVLGYSPKAEMRDGRYHRVEVKLNPPRGLPKLTAHWRQGYFAASQ